MNHTTPTDTHTFIGKRLVGWTSLDDFSNYQGTGHDPLYKRYDSVLSIIKRVVDPQFAGFLAVPNYDASKDGINWYIDDWKTVPERLVELDGPERQHYESIKRATVAAYKASLKNLSGNELQIMAGALVGIDDEFIYCTDNKVYALAWGMEPDRKNIHRSMGQLVHESPTITRHKVTFDVTTGGQLHNPMARTARFTENYCISPFDLPQVDPFEGYSFEGWSPEPVGHIVTGDITFTAIYRESAPIVTPPIIPADEDTRPVEPEPEPLPEPPPPPPTPKPKKRPWYKRWWSWLITALLALLILLLCCLLLPDCKGCSHKHNVIPTVDIENPDVSDVHAPVPSPDPLKEVPIVDGQLPEEPIYVPPFKDWEDELPPIISVPDIPGSPQIIADRLILYLEEDDGDLDALADDFRKTYTSDKYKIIGYDQYVKSLTISVPPEERDNVRETINDRLPNHNFFVVDDYLMELNSIKGNPDTRFKGWHLEAVQAPLAWEVTKGSPDIVVAVVDDGLDISHPMFAGRIVKPYNVIKGNSNVSYGSGHGTHVAGLAVGALDFYNDGAAGIAPNCKLMPIEVFDGNATTASYMISGMMYAMHNGADIINISMGPQLTGINSLPEKEQLEIAHKHFKEQQKVFERICRIAAKRNIIVIFAAGNDTIISLIPPENRPKEFITVGAVNQYMHPAEFSNYGEGTDISAPGKNIYSSVPVKKFDYMDGTSMAAPIVTGAVALMRSLDPQITAQKANQILYETGYPVSGDMPPMIQIANALYKMQGKTPPSTKNPAVQPEPGNSNGAVVVPGDPTSKVIEKKPGVVIPNPGVAIPNPGVSIPDVNGKSITVIDNETGESSTFFEGHPLFNFFKGL